MRPDIGPLPAFLLGWIVAAVLGGGSVVWLLWRARLRSWQISVAFASLVASVLLGSKFLYLLEAWPEGKLWAAVFSRQMRIPGGFVLAIGVYPLLARIIGVRPLWLADIVTPAAGLCIFGVRIGCFLEGCCHGTPSTLAWAVRFPAFTEAYGWQVQQQLISLGAATTLPVHPLQLYFGAVGLLIFLGLVWYGNRKRYDGELLLHFAVSYLWSTWVLELLRAHPHDFTRQLVLAGSLAATIVAVIVEWRIPARCHAGRRTA